LASITILKTLKLFSMKKLIFILTMFALVSCEKTDEQKIVKNLSEYYKIDIPDTTGTGVILYRFDASRYDKTTYKFIYDDPFVMEPKIKGAVDRAMKALPLKTKEKSMLNVYEWENMQTKVLMENHFETAYDTPVIYLHVKIWITNK